MCGSPLIQDLSAKPRLAAPQRGCYLPPMTTVPIDNIRNFSIVAHIDHGKSTLADRLIQLTGGLSAPGKGDQMVHFMGVERAGGLPNKAPTPRAPFPAPDGKK